MEYARSQATDPGGIKVKQVLLVGTYNSSNKGDAAMQLTAATEIQSRFPHVLVSVSSPFPDLDAPFYAPLPVVRSDRRRLLWGSGKVARAWACRTLEHLGRREWGLLAADAELRAVRTADLVVDLSGDMMTEDYGPHVAYSHYLPVLLASALERPYVLCAQSIGPFKHTLPLAHRVLHGAEWITVRDELSLDYLHKLRARQSRIEFTADLAFLLEPVPAERALELMRDEGLPLTGKPLLGVSVSQLVGGHYARRNPNAESLAFVPLVARALDELAAELECRVLFVSHVTGPSRVKDDRVISRAVRGQMRAPSHVLEKDYGPRELKGIIGQCRAFVGARMHANIAALSSEVPVVALAYSHKTPGLMRLFNQQDVLLSIDELTEHNFVEKVRLVWHQRDERAGTVRDRLPELRARSRRNIDLIGETLGL